MMWTRAGTRSSMPAVCQSTTDFDIAAFSENKFRSSYQLKFVFYFPPLFVSIVIAGICIQYQDGKKKEGEGCFSHSIVKSVFWSIFSLLFQGRAAKAAKAKTVFEPEDVSRAPHTFVIKRGIVGRTIEHLMNDMRNVMEPYTASHLKVRLDAFYSLRIESI